MMVGRGERSDASAATDVDVVSLVDQVRSSLAMASDCGKGVEDSGSEVDDVDAASHVEDDLVNLTAQVGVFVANAPDLVGQSRRVSQHLLQ